MGLGVLTHATRFDHDDASARFSETRRDEKSSNASSDHQHISV
jgi:hypothetical protein